MTKPERKAQFTSISGEPVQRVYGPEALSEDLTQNLGYPGQFPYTRGVQPTMYRGRLWTMRQYAGFGSAEESNRRYRYLLEHGQTGLSVAFDLPTQMGYDSDHPMAYGEVGRVGVAIDTLEDMTTLFDQIPLDKVSTSMTINSTASILLALYVAVAEAQGVSPDKLRGTIQNDLLKEYIARGTYIYPVSHSLRIITDLFRYCKSSLPKWNAISISGYHMREAGCTAIQEVAFTLLDGMTYLEAARKVGISVDEIAPQLSFFFGVHNDFIEEIAKFRAARRLWARLMKERLGAKSEESCRLKFHTQTAGCSLTAQQPKNNIVRVAIQAMAAVLGGTQSLHTNSMDEALALPTELSAMVALRTQQMIAVETGVANTIDPCAGSYAIEAMTDRIEQGALDYIRKVDELGGMIRAIEAGFVQKEIQNAAYKYQKDVEDKQEIIVGVNAFTDEATSEPELLRVGQVIEDRQKEKLKKFKANRNQAKTQAALADLKKAAQGDDNVVPLILAAVKAHATLGEVSDTMRSVFGVYQEKIVI